nr:replication protein A 70 kDa DNA-binding subunit D-like [Ipomoea batatas]
MLKVGDVYSITNFLVISNFYAYKTSHMFRLQPLSTLKQKMDINEKELIDVIGMVVEMHSPQVKDPKLVAVYCRELLEAPDKDLTSELPKSLERILRMRMLLRVQVYQQIP